MKTLTCWLMFILFGSSVCAQIPSICTPTAAFLEAYKHDINYLAAKRMQDVHHPDTQYVTIPSIHKDSIIRALSTVFNLGNIAQADSVFYYRCMHTRFFSNTFTAHIDTNFAYTLAWQNNQTLTGDSIVDAFLLKYDLHIINFNNTNYADFYTTSPNFPLNMKGLADSFALLPGVTWSKSTMTQFFHVNEIQYQRDQSGTTLYFWLKWGDCMAGCTSAKIYAYQLDNACNVVNFLDTVLAAPDPYPGLINCLLSPLQTSSPMVKDELNVYPNPSSDLLHIERSSPSEEYAYSLCSALGVPILSGKLSDSGTLDISSLSAGIYFLLIREKNGRLLKRSIVKR